VYNRQYCRTSARGVVRLSRSASLSPIALRKVTLQYTTMTQLCSLCSRRTIQGCDLELNAFQACGGAKSSYRHDGKRYRADLTPEYAAEQVDPPSKAL
jgi:hypothetical protein